MTFVTCFQSFQITALGQSAEFYFNEIGGKKPITTISSPFLTSFTIVEVKGYGYIAVAPVK